MPTPRLTAGLLACLPVAALLLSACGPVATASLETAQLPAASKAVITAAPKAAKNVDPHQPITISADQGHLTTVRMVGPKGEISGQLSDDGTTWQADSSALDYGTKYRVEATAVDTRGVAATSSREFTTVEPRAFVESAVTPAEGSTVGVGMPITVTFDRDIKDRAAAEGALVVRTAVPVTGAWAWSGVRTAVFRPKDYWPGDMAVEVDVNLEGVEVAKGVFGKADTVTAFSTGPSTVIKVDAAKHTAKVIRDGENIRTIPITTGKAGFETRSGVTVIMTKERTRVMDAATGGTDESDPEYYRLEVEYAMRLTYSGEFLHAAPWSVGSQGYANVSHGCVGMSTSNAAWLFDQAQIGDPVEIKGTPVEQNLGNGITVWNEPWADWLGKSATGEIQTQPLEPAPQESADASVTASAAAPAA